MNPERILAVADAIEKHTIPELGFNMGYFFGHDGELPDLSGHNCGTTACIGGYARTLMVGSVHKADQGSYELDEGKWLDIDFTTVNQLFYASNHPAANKSNGTWATEFKSITPEQAVRTLRHLAATGTVDWTVE